MVKHVMHTLLVSVCTGEELSAVVSYSVRLDVGNLSHQTSDHCRHSTQGFAPSTVENQGDDYSAATLLVLLVRFALESVKRVHLEAFEVEPAMACLEPEDQIARENSAQVGSLYKKDD